MASVGDVMNHAIVFGYGLGTGAALTSKLAAAGYTVTAISRAEPQGLPAGVTWLGADVRRPVEVHMAMDTAVAEHGAPLKVFFNPVAVRQARGLDIDSGDIMDDLATSVAGAINVVQAVVPHMRNVPDASIVFTGGILSDNPHPMFTSVGVSKAALKNLVLAFAKELKATGIDIQLITVGGFIKPGTLLSPDAVAGRLFDAAHCKSTQTETLFDGH
jgi:NAD(P)-dependent dehydrogenase (short-subunit alcohol dehydrogenase family)